jgi:hypothetical protein
MALRVPGLLVVDGVDIGDLEEPRVVRLDRRVHGLRQWIHLCGDGDREARAAAAARAFRLYATQTSFLCKGGTEKTTITNPRVRNPMCRCSMGTGK